MEDRYVSFRIQKIENNRVAAQINHDMRIGFQPKYINRNLSSNNILLTGEKFNTEKMHEYKKEQNKRSKRKIQKNTERFISGIMTFSETMKNDYEDNSELFKNCSIDFLNKINEKYKLNAIYSIIHLDEKTPHIHLTFDNIDSTGKSVRRTINPQILKDIQTLMGESFSKMKYKRGKDKEITLAEHLTVSDYQKLKKAEIELYENLKEVKKDSKHLENLFDKMINNKKLTEEEKEEIKTIAPSFFQFLPEKASSKLKSELSNSISRALKI